MLSLTVPFDICLPSSICYECEHKKYILQGSTDHSTFAYG